VAAQEWPSLELELTSFDGGVRREARVLRPDRYRFWDRFPAGAPFIARGGGYSYAAASFGGGAASIEHAAFDRILDFDSASGEVRVEAGITLAALHRFLARRGWYLPTQPGYPAITVGGCIAAECHGKNHAKDGCFSRQVKTLELFHPAHGLMELSREREPDVFELTCGGFGLTGCIVSAVLQPRRLPGNEVTLRSEPLDDVRGLGPALRAAAREADFVYSWHDFNAGDRAPGLIVRGVIGGEPAPDQDSRSPPTRWLRWDNRSAWRVPAWNRASATLATALYRRAVARSRPVKTSLYDSLFPLQSRGGPYFRLFGAAGFCEFQAIVPEASFPGFCDAVFAYLRAHPLAITLASAKWFEDESRDLRFSGTGVCFALDFPRGGGADAFQAFLDGLCAEQRLRPSIIKDSRLPRAVVEKTYPAFGSFAQRLAAFDPERRCRSELSERLGL